jgi:signal transduction histidine kinase
MLGTVMADEPCERTMSTTTRIPVTYFAPAERVPIDIVHRQAASFGSLPLAATLLNSVLNCVFVLNAQRQIVFASESALKLVPGKRLQDILGQRPGEALGCIHARVCEGGCGTSECCSQCGAVQAILTSLTEKRDLQECHLTRLINCHEEALDLLVLAAPLVHNHERYSIISLADISHEKRRRALERIFFHDVVNLAGGAEAMLVDLAGRVPRDIRDDLELSRAALHDLLDEVQAQRDLVAAERDELAVNSVLLDGKEVLEQVVRIYSAHPLAAGRPMRLAPSSVSTECRADPTLLKRVLGNLVKNALEASASGEAVTVACEAQPETIRFSVHNPAVMPPAVQWQLFSRSFSTKGPGRGLGTYSAKLLTERYLKGTITFASSAHEGTTFRVELPLDPGGPVS